MPRYIVSTDSGGTFWLLRAEQLNATPGQATP